jgi:hypothetical protein
MKRLMISGCAVACSLPQPPVCGRIAFDRPSLRPQTSLQQLASPARKHAVENSRICRGLFDRDKAVTKIDLRLVARDADCLSAAKAFDVEMLRPDGRGPRDIRAISGSTHGAADRSRDRAAGAHEAKLGPFAATLAQAQRLDRGYRVSVGCGALSPSTATPERLRQAKENDTSG